MMQARNARQSADFQYWKAKDLGPTARERRILRRIEASGGLVLTYRNGGVSFAFGDGIPVKNEFGFDRHLFQKFTELCWIVPDTSSPALLPDMPAQAYQAGQWP